MSRGAVHVVVVAYHAPDQLDACLASIGSTLPVTVIDNSSSSPVRLVAARHGAEYVDSTYNRGFAGAANLALQRRRSADEDVLLVNPDALVAPDAIHALVGFFDQHAHARVAAVAPRLIDSTGGEQRVLWPFPSPYRAWLAAVGLGRLPTRDSYAIGAVLLLRGEAISAVGVFDERFFLYAEEADWQRRARTLGWTSAICSEAVATHAGAGTSRDPKRRELLFHAAQETYIRKWHGTVGWWSYRVAACVGAFARSVLLSGERGDEARRRALLYFRGPRRCAAPPAK